MPLTPLTNDDDSSYSVKRDHESFIDAKLNNLMQLDDTKPQFERSPVVKILTEDLSRKEIKDS